MGGCPLGRNRYRDSSSAPVDDCPDICTIIFLFGCFVCAILIPFQVAVSWYESTPRQRLVREMDDIYFRADQMTLSHRHPSKLQMVCSGDNCIPISYARYWRKPLIGPIVDMPLPDGVTLGDYNIVCEGWDEDDKFYYASGTCQLQYTLVGKPFTRKVDLMR